MPGELRAFSFGLITIYGVTHREIIFSLWLKEFFLITEPEQNWEAVDGSQRETEKKHFFINICHRVLQEGPARGCPEDAAACSVGELCPERGWFSQRRVEHGCI